MAKPVCSTIMTVSYCHVAFHHNMFACAYEIVTCGTHIDYCNIDDAYIR